ncbi:MAG: tRNA threonylcarbamoyladenosine dehydratase, partial [Bacteroidales bacterium]|nr:tRNA threonylcarbamoyladenosine dehydratase [Bacteroidales bacterium]
ARAGVGNLVLIDADSVSISNINRQLPALQSTVGQDKCDVVQARLEDINPSINIQTVKEFLCEENIPKILGGLELDCVVDCIDTLSPKIALVQHCLGRGVHLVSSMGSGAKTDATRVRIDDISRTIQCPLARMLRKRLHKLGITTGFTAVYSTERPDHDAMVIEETRNKKSQTGTISYLPAVFGCVCAQAAVSHIVSIKGN